MNVGALVDRRVAAVLLGRHVARRAHDETGDAPVEDEDLAELADHHILRLEIAMNDAMRMRKGHCVAHAQEDREARVRIGRRRPAIEALPAHTFHRIEQTAVCQPAEVVNGHHARMLEPRQDARLLLKMLGQGLIADKRIEHLDRYLAVEHRIACEVDGADAAAAEHRQHLISRAGEIRLTDDALEAIERGVGNHGADLMKARASAWNSSSLAHCSRSTFSTRRRNSRRAAASSLVTSVTARPSATASSA